MHRPCIDDQWRLHEILMDFGLMRGKHDGSNIAEGFLDVLRQYNLIEMVLYFIKYNTILTYGILIKLIISLNTVFVRSTLPIMGIDSYIIYGIRNANTILPLDLVINEFVMPCSTCIN